MPASLFPPSCKTKSSSAWNGWRGRPLAGIAGMHSFGALRSSCPRLAIGAELLTF